MADLIANSGDSAKAVLVDPNNASITQSNPQGIDDPHSYRARQGFIGIGDLWAGDNSGTVYLQGHLVIPGEWGNVSTNGETTTTTDDTTDKDGGDPYAACCSLYRTVDKWYQQYKWWDKQIYNWEHYDYYEECLFDEYFDIVISSVRRTTFVDIFASRFILWLFGLGSFPNSTDIKEEVLEELTFKRDRAKQEHKVNCEQYCSQCSKYLSTLGQPSGCYCDR